MPNLAGFGIGNALVVKGSCSIRSRPRRSTNRLNTPHRWRGGGISAKASVQVGRFIFAAGRIFSEARGKWYIIIMRIGSRSARE
jgi:hypothetical protein